MQYKKITLIIIILLSAMTICKKIKKQRPEESKSIEIKSIDEFKDNFVEKMIIFNRNNYKNFIKYDSIIINFDVKLTEFKLIFQYLNDYVYSIHKKKKMIIVFKKGSLFGRTRYDKNNDSKNNIIAILKLLREILKSKYFKITFHNDSKKYYDGFADLKEKVKEFTDGILLNENLSVLDSNNVVDLIPIVIEYHNQSVVKLSNLNISIIDLEFIFEAFKLINTKEPKINELDISYNKSIKKFPLNILDESLFEAHLTIELYRSKEHSCEKFLAYDIVSSIEFEVTIKTNIRENCPNKKELLESINMYQDKNSRVNIVLRIDDEEKIINNTAI